MIIRIFNQGQGKGSGPIKYLFDEKIHAKYKPELVSGNATLTKSIIDSLSFKHKYVSGVIAFRDDEKLTQEKQLKLINDFQKTFAPFDKQERVNFLWVRHYDKGNLELHFICPRVDLKTKKSFNLHPPGKANELFFQSFTRIQNIKHGFKQVDNLNLSTYQFEKTVAVFTDLHAKRKEYLSSTFDKKEKATSIKYHDTRRTTNTQFNKKSREFGSVSSKSTLFNSINAVRNHEDSTARTAVNYKSFVKDGQAGYKLENHGNETRQLLESSREFRESRQSDNRPHSITICSGIPLEEEIRQLSLSLNDCSPSQAYGIVARLNALQGQLSRQAPKPKF